MNRIRKKTNLIKHGGFKLMGNGISKFKGLLLAIAILVFMLAACTNDEDQLDVENGYDDTLSELEEEDTESNDDEEYNYEVAYELEDYNEDSSAEIFENHDPFGTPDWLSLIQITAGTRDIMLEDFDYLTASMLENAPTLGVFERRFNISMAGALAEIRQAIYNIEPAGSSNHAEDLFAAADHLSRLFDWFAGRVQGLGHFGTLPLVFYMDFLELFSAALHQAENVDGRLIWEGEDIGDANLFQGFVDSLSSEETLWFYGIDLADLNLYRDLEDLGWHIGGNVTTDVIRENQIAYLRINSFMMNGTFDSTMLFPFYEAVQGFEHLIIDLRGNGGGYGDYFRYYVMAMLTDSPLEVRFNEFLTAGEAARHQVDFNQEWSLRGVESAEEILLASDFVNHQTLPYFNEADLDVLHYMVRWRSVIEPREDNIPFAGDIWVLVDQRSASASELAAIQSMSSGFATVVGTPTAGITPAMAVFVPLPNTGMLFRIDTGYMVDDLGRSIEEFGVTPNIVIEPESDALNVVLDLIDGR